MPAPLDASEVDFRTNWWEYEPIQDAIDRNRGAAMQAWETAQPYADSGDWEAAQGAISAAMQGANPEPPPQDSYLASILKDAGSKLKTQWESTPKDPGVYRFTPDSSSATGVRADVVPKAPHDDGGWLDAVKGIGSRVFGTVGAAVQHGWQAQHDTDYQGGLLGGGQVGAPGAGGAEDVQAHLGSGNQLIKTLSGNRASLEGLPDGLFEAADVGLSPDFLVPVGGSIAATAAEKGAGAAANLGAREAAGAAAGVGAQNATARYGESDLPGADIAANPITQLAAAAGAGLAGYHAAGPVIEHAPSVARAAMATSEAGELNLGAFGRQAAEHPDAAFLRVALEAADRGDNGYLKRYGVTREQAEEMLNPTASPRVEAPPPPAAPPPGGPLGAPPPPPPAAPRYQVPEKGTGEAAAALQREAAVYQPATGATFDAEGNRAEGARATVGKAAGLLNPAADTHPTVVIANRARGHVQAELSTQFSMAMNPLVREVSGAIEEAKPTYTGPAPKTNAQRALIGTEADIVQRPSAYQLTPRAEQAISAFDRGQWERVSAPARAEYGVDVAPFNIEGGGAFVPNILRKDGPEARIESTQRQYSRSGGTAERAYQTLWDRAGQSKNANAQFETDLGELTAVHSETMARNAANATFRQGVGGLTKVQALDQTHPGLVQAKADVLKALASAKARLETATGQQGDAIKNYKATTAEARRIEQQMAPLQARVESLGDEYGAELSHLSGQIYELRKQAYAVRKTGVQNVQGARVAGAGSTVDSLLTQVDQLQAKAEALVKRYQQADPAGGGDLVLDPTTHLYQPPDIAQGIAKVSHQNTGGTKSVINALDEIRAIRFAGDASPVTNQGQLGVSATNPVTTIRRAVAAVVHPAATIRRASEWLHTDPELQLERIAEASPDDVAEYSYSMGRPFLRPTQADEAIGAGKGLSREDVTIKGRTIPLPGRVFGPLENKMWSLVQAKTFDLWQTMRDQEIARGSTPEQAAADAAKTVQKLIPSQDPTQRALSPARAQTERAVLTSTSFLTAPPRLIADAARGMAKLAASNTVRPGAGWSALSGSERLAVQRVAYMAGTVTTLSVASAAASAESRGLSPMDAVKEALNPDSRYFMALQLGGGRAVPIGGPFRSFIKAMAPGNPLGPGGIEGAVSRPFENLPGYLRSKIGPVPSWADSLLRNEDWQGNPVRGTGSPTKAQNLLKELWFTGESVLPLGLGGQAAADIRTGNASDLGTFGSSAASQLAGTSYSSPSPTEQLSQFSRNWPDNAGQDFFDSPKNVQAAIKAAHPDTWGKYLDGASENTRKNEAAKSKYEGEQQGRDQAFLGGDPITVQQWRDSLDTAKKQLQGEQAQIFGQSNLPPRNAADRYFQTIDKNSKNGIVDWTAVDDWLGQQPPEDQQYIDQNTGLGGTPLQRYYRAKSEEYAALPQYRGLTANQGRQVNDLIASARNFTRPRRPGEATPQAELLNAITRAAGEGKVSADIASAARAVVMKRIPEAPDRTRWRQANGAASTLLHGTGQLSQSQLDAIAAELKR